jgi:hypothetical protein
MSFDRARAVADAVLFEGYALYPYRPTAAKNLLRWQFGVLAPRVVSEATKADSFWMETQCLVTGARVTGKLRFLRIRRRRIETLDGEPVASLEVDDQLLVPWDEGEICEVDFVHLVGDQETIAVELEGDETVETVGTVARVRRARCPLSLRLHLSADRGPAVARLRIFVENLSPCADPLARREETLISATLGTHVMLAVEDGEFVSLLDPPPEAAEAAKRCRNVGCFPVLAGEPGRNDLLLASPIILYDHPQVAPESPGNLFDACEIDEILSLRTLLLTDEEKRLARATDARVAAVVDRVEQLPEQAWLKLHGAFRAPHEVGARVRLRPKRRTDAQDMFLEGRAATVREVKWDFDGRQCLAVTIDDDPGADLHDWFGRYHYFYADEVEPC